MGYYVPTRSKLKMQVLRGYPGNSASNLSRVAFAKNGEAIVSGTVCQLDSDGLVVKGIQDKALPVYVAYHDQTDGDAIEAGMLLFDVAGNYEFQSSIIAVGQTFTEGTPVTANTSGALIAATPATDAIIGYATREVSGSCIKDLTGEVSGALDLTALTFTSTWVPVHV